MTVLSSELASTFAAAIFEAAAAVRPEALPKKAEAVTEDVASSPPAAVMVWLEVKVLAWLVYATVGGRFAAGTVRAAASWLALLIELTAIEDAMTVLRRDPASTLAAATLFAVTPVRPKP